MSATLSQSSRAAFPDRNPEGKGLLAELQSGVTGQFVDVTFETPRDQLHSRFLINPNLLTGGATTVAAAVGTAGHDAWSMRYNANTRQLTLATPHDGTLQTSLLNGPPWLSIEVGFDAPGTSLSLWINGQLADSLTLSSSPHAVERCMIGAIQKDTNAVGEIHFDEWITSGTYVGPAVIEPVSDHADDPKRWLVVYNAAAQESIDWVESYRQARSIPFANCLGLDLSLSESIDTAEYESMLSMIEGYLDQNQLRSQIMGILVGYRVPGYVMPTGTTFKYPVASLLHNPQTNLFSTPNPASTETIKTRPVKEDLSHIRLTARIDGPDLDKAKRLHQRSIELTDSTLTPQDQLYVDPTPMDFTLPARTQRVMDWYRGLGRQNLRLKSHISGDPDTQNDARYVSIDQDAFYWGWGPAEPVAGFFSPSSGPRIACVQLRTTSVNATTLRSSTPSHWVDTALDAGYAAAVGTSLSSSPDSILYARPFFEALRRGWTLAEAYILASPRVQDGYFLVGDPLLSVSLPKEGWNVFGPISRSQDLDADVPCAALPLDETTLSLTGEKRPEPSDTGLYLVRRVDEQGRSEANFQPLLIGRQNDSPVATLPPVAWPNHDFWKFHLQDGIAEAILTLGVSQNPGSLLTAELVNDQDSTAVRANWIAKAHQAATQIDLPANPTRYRWRLTSAGGLIAHTPWSATLAASDASDVSLTILEPA